MTPSRQSPDLFGWYLRSFAFGSVNRLARSACGMAQRCGQNDGRKLNEPSLLFSSSCPHCSAAGLVVCP